MTPEEIVARLIYRDGLMLVIDKPAGLAVHKGPKGGESLEDYFGALRFGLPRPPALAQYHASGAQRMYLQVLDLSDLEHIREIAQGVQPGATSLT